MNLKTLDRSEKLKSTKSISGLFETGSSLTIHPVRLVYQVNPSIEKSGVKIGFVVPKKNFKKAVDRNLLKRRMREAYRLNKNDFYYSLAGGSPSLEIMLVFQSREMENYDTIFQSIKSLLKKLSDKVVKKRLKPDFN